MLVFAGLSLPNKKDFFDLMGNRDEEVLSTCIERGSLGILNLGLESNVSRGPDADSLDRKSVV